jgi:hypothetical protein
MLRPSSLLCPEVLEASSIAWPNAAMWRQVSLVGPYYAQQVAPQQTVEEIEVCYLTTIFNVLVYLNHHLVNIGACFIMPLETMMLSCTTGS